MEMLRRQVKAVDAQIFAAVRTQTGAQARSKQDLSVATAQIGSLVERVRGIQARAGDTETLVQEICRDIRKLDAAKRHLTHTIASLRRLAMLTAAVDDLEAVGRRRDQYRRAANLLEAVGQLMEYFGAYAETTKVASLNARLASVRSALTVSGFSFFLVCCLCLFGGGAALLSPKRQPIKQNPKKQKRTLCSTTSSCCSAPPTRA